MRLSKLLAPVAFVAAVAVAPLAAWAMTVQPVVLDLTTAGRGMSQVITVENTFATPLPVEMRVEDLILDETGVKGAGKDSGDLAVFPPTALIPPGQTQTFRVQWVGDPDIKASKHYYVTVAQLPVQLPEGQSAIQILYNFQVLASAAPTGGRHELKLVRSEIGKNDKGQPIPILYVENTGSAHGYLSRGTLRLTAKDAAGRTVLQRTLPGPEIQQVIGFGLIGANQTRRVSAPIVLPEESVSLEADFVPDPQR